MSEEQTGQNLFQIPKTLSNHEYTHRLMRLLGLVHILKVKDDYPHTEFLIRSCMISNVLIANMHEKLEIEAGTLSYIPQYCNLAKKSNAAFIKGAISENFGRDVLELVMEVEELRQSFVNDESVEGYSRHAKEIYGAHIYLDLVNMLNPNVDSKVIDGVLYTINVADELMFDKYIEDGKERKIRIEQGSEWIQYDGQPMSMSRYYCFMVAISKWKLEQLRYVRVTLQQSIAELSQQITKQKGIIVQ